MPLISNYLSDKQVAKRVQMIIDETTRQYKERDTLLLNEIAPIKEFDTFDFQALLTEEIVPAASIVAPDQEIPLSQMGTLTPVMAELAKIVVKHRYNETLQKKMYQAMELAEIKGVQVYNTYNKDGSIRSPGSNNDLATILFGNHARMAMACYDRLDAMTMEALFYGKLREYKDPITGNLLEVDFTTGFDTSTYNPFPPALTGTEVWSDKTHADGIQNLVDANYAYVDINGGPADYILMSLKTYNALLAQTSTKDAATQIRGMSVGAVSPQAMDNILSSYSLPPIRIINAMYKDREIQMVNGRPVEKIVSKKFVPEGYFAFAKKDMGLRAIGLTLESSTSTLGDGELPKPQKGLHIKAWEEKHSPPADYVQATLSAIPIFLQPKFFYARKVM